MKNLSNEYIAEFCMETALMLRAGLNVSDGIDAMLEEDNDPLSEAVLKNIKNSLEQGDVFSEAIKGTGGFPVYAERMIRVAEQSGRLEETLVSLSEYYDSKERIKKEVISAVLYPAFLFILMTAVAGALLMKVMPVFDSLYKQLGMEMTGAAAWLLSVGNVLRSLLPAAAVIFFVLILLFFLFISGRRKETAVKLLYRFSGEKGIAEKLALAKFLQALGLSVKSGLDVEQSVRLSAATGEDSLRLREKSDKALTLLEQGWGLSDAFLEVKLLPAAYCRILGLANKSGNLDEVIDGLARRAMDDFDEAIEKTVGKIEPLLVSAAAVLIGGMLLAVIMPMFGIMATL